MLTARRAYAYVSARGFLVACGVPHGACVLRCVSLMTAGDWYGLARFLAAFPDLRAPELGRAAPGIELLDYADAWNIAALAPPMLRIFRCGIASEPLPPASAAFILAAPLTVASSVGIPLHVLRRWAGARGTLAPSVNRRVLVPLINTAFASARHAATPAATPAAPPTGALADALAEGTPLQVRLVVPRHLHYLRAMYPWCNGLAEINAWVRPLGFVYKLAQFYVAPPPPLPPRDDGRAFTAAAPPHPHLLALAARKFGVAHLHSVAAQVRYVQMMAAEPTFCLPCDVLDVLAPDNGEDATTLTPWAAMPREAVVCWGSLRSARYLSVDDLQGWFDAADVLARFEQAHVLLTAVEVHDLLDVLSAHCASLTARAAARTAADVAVAGALRRLVDRIRVLRNARATRAGVSAAAWEALTSASHEERDALGAALRALHEFAAYALHWRGPGTPLPRVGDAILHLEDAVDAEARMYETALPPLISALAALPPHLHAALRELPQYAAHGVPGSIAIGTALDALQAGTAVTHKLCIRLAAAPLWHAAVAHAANFCRLTLPPYV